MPGTAAHGRTSTSAFGVSRRESHDASAFYERFTPPAITRDSAVSPRKAVDALFCGDARHMDEVDDDSVALVVTSPPYFAGKEYERALGEGDVPATYAAYLQMLEEVFAECVRKLEPGGRIAVNVANLGRKPYRSLSADVTWILQDRLRLLLRGEVIWIKGRAATGSCAWGSFQRPANPVLRDLSERIVIASKGRFDRALTARERCERDLPAEASISRDEFMEATTDLWEMPPESASRIGHPAPFPAELPERLIHLYTYRGDLVLDPFIGSGTTAVAAVRAGRHYAGYDTDAGYVAAAKRRLRGARALGTHGQHPVDGHTGDDLELAIRNGDAAGEVARRTLLHCGFTEIDDAVRVGPGLAVAFAASDKAGRRWLFDVVGGFTSNRPGLRRAELLWKALTRAAVVHQVDPSTPLVLLTTGTPAPATPGAAALTSLTGPAKPVRCVAVLGTEQGLDTLRGLAGVG